MEDGRPCRKESKRGQFQNYHQIRPKAGFQPKTIHLLDFWLIPAPKGSGKSHLPEGKARLPQGKSPLPEGMARLPQGKPRLPEGKPRLPEGEAPLPEGKAALPQGKTLLPEGKPALPKRIRRISGPGPILPL